MAEPSQGERIRELEARLSQQERLNAVLQSQLDAAREEATAARNAAHEHQTEIALLKRDVEDLKKDRERVSQRLWTMVTGIAIGVVVTVVGAAAVASLGIRKP